MRGVQKCTCAGASLRGSNFVPLCCIKLDTATDPACGTAGFLVSAAEYIRKACCEGNLSAPRLTSMICKICDDLYMNSPGDDTTVAVARIVKRKNINIFTGPPTSYDDDAVLMRDFMTTPGKKIVSGGTSANIASRILNKKIVAAPSVVIKNVIIPIINDCKIGFNSLKKLIILYNMIS